MIAVLIIPTGVGAAIGGNAGDGNPVAKLLSNCCDNLITHPNVVNAADINEMTENTLYVEGSLLDRFLAGYINLRKVISNRMLVVANPPVTEETINAVSAARATIGIKADILELNEPLRMIAQITTKGATGQAYGIPELIEQVRFCQFDALAIHTPIEVERNIALNYYRNGGINPWGGIEAKVSREIANALNKPVAHAPLENTDPNDKELFLIFQQVVQPRIAAEAISNCYLHCVLKGLHRAPRIGYGLCFSDVAALISPYRCWGRPHIGCKKNGIPVITVRENTICAPTDIGNPDIIAENYLEAAGILMSMRAGVSLESIRTNLPKTTYISRKKIK
jgi:hypothetical protein